MDRIMITDLCIETVIGAYAWERKVKQKVLLNIELATDALAISTNDDLADALDYASLSEQLTTFISTSNYQLLESLAEHSAQFIFQHFAVTWLRLAISKPGAIPNAKTVSVAIERERNPS